MIRNLGQVAAIYIGSSAPRNTNLIWLDNTGVPFVFRAYDGSAWSEIATHKWVRAYVDGWLVTLPPRQLADDGDYMLINSNNVNYKITVKDFVKSAVGNPLDFKGVIRVSADFPNPSTLESGDMYVIITSPAGGTVTDPYSGKTFEDSEKIVWDEVTQSWESLGKIDITVDLTTSYSETEVTIHSSAGKETTIQGATDQLAGVMLPGQYSWLQALSNGSIVPGDPSPLTPLTPAHKHNYNDIINRLVSQQGTGESTIDPMSQKATTDALNLKFDKASVLQVSGAATDKVMSQKAVTDALKTLSDDFNNKLTNYLPLVGGTMKGSIRFPAESGIIGNADGTGDTYILRSFNNRLDIGSAALSTRIISNASDLLHHRSDTSYKIWDSYNLSKPTVYNGGAIGTPTTIYDRNLSVNGTGWTFLSATNAPTTSIFAPTTVGTKGYYLVSGGTGAPVWQQLEDLGDGKYLPLIGGTLTGQVTIQQNVDIKLRLQSTDTDNYCIIQAINAQASQLGVFGYAGDKWAIGHGGTYYEIWDKFNLSDPATLSGNNTFTGNNTFQAGKFNVGPFEVTSSGSLLSNISSPAGSAWSRGLIFRANNDIPSSLIFGGYNSVDNTNLGYAYIGIGDVNFSTAQYKFRPTSLKVPITWSLDDSNGNALVWTQDATLAHLGRASGTTKIRSGNVNLIHTKGTTDYTILDSSNYTEFLPQNIAWTYGFVSRAANNDGYDANSMIGVDKPKLLFNYYAPGKIVNAPTGMGYGNVLQIDGPYTPSYNEAALKTQLAFDIIHNVDNGTGRMWYRTANNKGMAVANWRRVLTADENIAGLSFDGNNYPAIIRVDGTAYLWLRANGNGFLPNVGKSLASGGASQLGSSNWAFLAGYIASVYTNKLVFGVTGPYMIASTNAFQFLNSAGGVHKVATGGLYVGTSYASDALSLVPANGIYSRGIIYIENGIGFRNSIWTNDLTPNRNYSGYLQVLDAYAVSSAGGPTNYGTVLQVNSRNAHWANQLWFPGGAEASKNGLYYRHMAYNETTYGGWHRLLTNKDVNILSASYNNNPNSLPTNQIFYAETQGVAGTPTSSGLLFSVQGDDEGIQLWASSTRTGLYYRTKWTSFGNWIKLATTSDLGNYLPLTGGTLSGQLIIGYAGSTPLIVNNSHTNGVDSILNFKVKGVNKTLVGYSNGNGPFIQDASNNRCIMVKSDGAYFGTGLGAGTKLALITDIPTVSGYLPLSGGTMSGNISFNGDTGHIVVGARETSNYVSSITYTKGSTENAAIMGYHSTGGSDSSGALILVPYSTSANPWGKTVGLYIAKNELLLDGKAIATTDQIPSIPSISISNSGSGNAVTSITASGHTLTVTKGATYLTSSSLDGYATQSWANGQFASLSLYNTTGGYTTIRTRGNEFCLGNTIATSASNEVIVNYRIPSGCTYAPSTWVWRAGSSTSYANGYWGSLYMNGDLVATQTWVNNKGYLTSHQTIYNLTFQAGTFSAKTFDPNGAAATVNIPTNTSHLTNDSGFITSSALNGYATQAWVNSQNFVKSTSTKKVTDIQPVDALPATQASGVLYLVFG